MLLCIILCCVQEKQEIVLKCFNIMASHCLGLVMIVDTCAFYKNLLSRFTIVALITFKYVTNLSKFLGGMIRAVF